MGPGSQSTYRCWTKKRLLLAVGLLGVIATLVIVIWKMGLMEAADAVVLGLREAGPGVFFLAMAVLPAVGFPMMAFTLTAGPVFGPTQGAGWVIVWSLAAAIGNLLLTYWLGNRALRPLVSRLLAYFEIALPDVTAAGAWQIALIVRLTPGPPYWAQSYLLGLIRVPLVPYLVVSTSVIAGYIVALVCGGVALAKGNGRLAFAAAGVLVVSVAALQLWRKRSTHRKAAAARRD
jgi:uncharacterized membrane protein YdjX (TVP38/TMEM64 family)